MPLPQVEGVLCENKFGSYCVPASSPDRPASKTTLRGAVWELETIELMRAKAGSRSIVHAGMFFGDFLPGLASALAPGQHVYGFEPNPENFACAQWTARLNNLENVILTNVGVGRQESRRPMRMFEDGKAIGGRSRIVTNAERQAMAEKDVVPVRLVSIDAEIPESINVGIIQLDVEEWEMQALEGAISTIRRCLPLLIVETTPTKFIDEHLKPLGYRHVGRVRSNDVFEASFLHPVADSRRAGQGSGLITSSTLPL